MSLPHGRVFNFSAGPSTLPVEVLEQAQRELLNYDGTGMSVMEMSHRSKPFEAILGRAEQSLRGLLSVPNGYRVLFLQGGASLQFATIPLAFLAEGKKAGYVVTGTWGEKALESARTAGATEVLWTGKAGSYRSVPTESDLTFDASQFSYIHTTSNETIQGVQFPNDLELEVPQVCDMSSDILSRPVEVNRYACLYGGAQKNIGPAGLTLVIIRDDFLATHRDGPAPMLDYRVHAKNGSLYNTPPAWSIYITMLTLELLEKTGGLRAAAERNAAKAAALSDVIDRSGGFYQGHAAGVARSKMNVTFTLPSEALTDAFVAEAESHGMDGLRGHRSVGGIRASIYNAFPIEGALALADFMTDFASRNA